ncbi:MAG: DUF2478 domain-containing protein [Pseudomonadota bacterium]
MLGYVTVDGVGAADMLLAEVALALRARGWPLAGAVQFNPDGARNGKCHMDLHLLASHDVVRISQDLGPLSRGCRLDPEGLEHAAGLAETTLSAPTRVRLAIVNKFGKTEIDGRGFRPFIGRALAQGVPVLTAVGPAHFPAFHAFAEDLAEPIEPRLEAVLSWADAASTEPA